MRVESACRSAQHAITVARSRFAPATLCHRREPTLTVEMLPSINTIASYARSARDGFTTMASLFEQCRPSTIRSSRSLRNDVRHFGRQPRKQVLGKRISPRIASHQDSSPCKICLSYRAWLDARDAITVKHVPDSRYRENCLMEPAFESFIYIHYKTLCRLQHRVRRSIVRYAQSVCIWTASSIPHPFSRPLHHAQNLTASPPAYRVYLQSFTSCAGQLHTDVRPDGTSGMFPPSRC